MNGGLTQALTEPTKVGAGSSLSSSPSVSGLEHET